MSWSSTSSALRTALAAAALCLAAGAAQAADSVWNHNGSQMMWHADGDMRVISYLAPRSGLPVAPGTVLFEGRRVGDILEGTARTFRQGCPPAEYYVSGPVTSETRVVLTGAAPVRAASGCAITGYSTTSSNSVLEFTYLRSAEASIPGQDGGNVTVRPADEEYGQDAVGYQTYIVPLSSAAEIHVRVDTGVGSHVMPDMVSASIRCSAGGEYPLIPEGQLNVCAVDDVSAQSGSRTLLIEASRYNHETGACDPLRFEYSYAGYCQ